MKVSLPQRDFLAEWLVRPTSRLESALGRVARSDAETGLRYCEAMNPARKRTVRLIVALSAAVVLASALIYTSFSAASPALSPSQLVRDAQPGRSYQLTGPVATGSVQRRASVLHFSVEDRVGGTTIP